MTNNFETAGNIFAGSNDPRRPAISAKFWLFVVFASYGPAVSFVGQLRYTELLLLALFVIVCRPAMARLDHLERNFALLFLLTAFVQAFADIVNVSPIENSVRRIGTYIILASQIVLINYLVKDSPAKLKVIIAGYCLSYFFVYLFGVPVVSRHYHLLPWRLGLGVAMTLLLCVAFVYFRKLALFRDLLLMAMGLLHFAYNARSLGAIVLIASLLVFIGRSFGRRAPFAFNGRRALVYFVCGIMGLLIVYEILEFATENQWFPEETQRKMEAQLFSPVGLLAAGRPDTATALYAIAQRPIFGYGAGQPNEEINLFYAKMVAASYAYSGNYSDVLLGVVNRGFDLGIPSHSHVFSAWAEGGIFAIWSWVATLLLCLYVLVRSVMWNSVWAPLFIVVASLTLWDVLFSPGPTRLDIAIRICTLCFAVRMIKMQTGYQEKFSN